MKKAAVLLAIVMLPAALALAAIDFTGVWAFNASKSDQATGSASGDLTIKQNGNTLTISRISDENMIVTTYVLDGADHTVTPTQPSTGDLETPEYAKSMISLDGQPTARSTGGNSVVVEGSGANHDKYQHDIVLTATLLDAGGTSVGTATGRLEDLAAGHQGQYKLTGTATSSTWARVEVVISSVTEHVAVPQRQIKYKAVLSGDSVHITGTQASSRGEQPLDQTYTLSSDGKTLTIVTVRQGQSGPTSRKQVYDRK